MRRGMVPVLGFLLILGAGVGVAARPAPSAGAPARHPAARPELSPCVTPVASPSPTASTTPKPNDPVLPSPPPATGTPWTTTLAGSGPSCSLWDVVRFGHGFAATRGTTVLLSPDGLTWPDRGVPLPHSRRAVGLPRLVAFQGALYAFAAKPGVMAGWRLDVGGAWRELDLPQVPAAIGTTQEATAVAAVDGRLLLVGGVRTLRFDRSCESVACPDTTYSWTTTDGRAWRLGRASNPDASMLQTSDGQPGMIDRLWPMGDRIGALGPNGRVLTTKDGVHWMRVGRLPPGSDGITDLGYRPAEAATYALFIRNPLDEAETATVVRSTDLAHWDVAYQLPGTRWTGSAIDVTDQGIAIGGFSDGWFPWMALSADGVTWDLSVGWPGDEHGSVDALAIGPARIVAIGGLAAAEGPLAWAHDSIAAGPDPSPTASPLAFPSPPSPSSSGAPATALAALQCERPQQDTGPQWIPFHGPSTSPEEALTAAVTSAWMIPLAGYEALARTDNQVIFGFRAGGRVKAAVMVRGTPTSAGWAATEMRACPLAELGTHARLRDQRQVWVDPTGRTLFAFSLAGSCDAPSVTELRIPEDSRRSYFRDPKHLLPFGAGRTYDGSGRLPADAVDTGYRRGRAQLWMAADHSAVFVVTASGRVERWARGMIACG